MNRRGFSLYLTFLVTTIVFLLVTGSYEISRIALDMSRSDAIEIITFHAADGGLERGLSRLHREYKPFTLSYTSAISSHRQVNIVIEAFSRNGLIDLQATASLFEGKNELGRRTLSRLQISNLRGRTGIGKFVEAT